MGYHSQGSPRKGAGQKFQKSQHEKAKAKAHKHRARDKSLREEKPIASAEEIAEKTILSLRNLGAQKFAVSPYGGYFDDWLINVKEVLSEFEANPAINADEAFTKERERLVTKTGQELAKLKQDEATLDVAAKELADTNHLLVELDAEYAAKTRELGPKKNSEIQSLTLNVRSFEAELERVKAMKTSFFGFTKKAKMQKEADVLRKLESAKTELETALQRFKVEQEKLHDDYEQNKQTAIEKVQLLEKEVEKADVDSSLVIRSNACEALVETVNALLDRQSATSTDTA